MTNDCGIFQQLIAQLSVFTNDHLAAFCNDLINTIDVGNGLQYIGFQNSALTWDKGSTSLLLVRNEYKAIFTELMRIFEDVNDPGRLIVTGSPGVGKSLFGWWMVYKLV